MQPQHRRRLRLQAMNPFDWSGPPFLSLFLVVSVAAIWIAARRKRAGEDGPTPTLPVGDPYPIAYLRGGPTEALRVALVSLVSRRMLLNQGNAVCQAADQDGSGLPPIERQVFAFFQDAQPVTALFDTTNRRSVEALYRPQLEQLGLLCDPEHRRARWRSWLLFGGGLTLLAVLRIALAIERGRGNIWFLVALTVLSIVVLSVLLFRNSRTAIGDRVVRDMKAMFGGMRQRLAQFNPQDHRNELLLLASVYGIGVIPIALFPEGPELFRRAYAGDSGGAMASACGSSCSSSDGGSSDSGCGGCGGGGD